MKHQVRDLNHWKRIPTSYNVFYNSLKSSSKSDEIQEIGNNDDELVPQDVAEVIAESLKSPKQVTSNQIKLWATEQQK